MAGLFVLEDFVMHSGGIGHYKIECDALTDSDWATLAYMISEKVNFKFVRGVPTGGLKLQNALFKYRDPNSKTFLIVDDVLTTGNSMNEFKSFFEGCIDGVDEIIGAVVFARDVCPDWVMPLFRMY